MVFVRDSADGDLPIDPTRFCTGHSLAAGEPLAGWAAHQERNILIRWPKAKWNYSLRIASGMEADLEVAIGAAADAGWRINLIDRKGDVGTDVTVLVFPDALRLQVTTRDLPRLLEAVTSGSSLASFSPKPLNSRLVLVCTHGKHDRCCAKFGFAAYKAIQAEAQKYDAAFDVWEITHLGGCRFAGGALVLPEGRKYGRLEPSDAAGFLASEAEDRPFLPAYRGSTSLSAPAQVAEVTALRAMPHSKLLSVTELDTPSVSGRLRFCVLTTMGKVTVFCEEDIVTSYGACSDLDAAKPLKPKSIWRGKVVEHATT